MSELGSLGRQCDNLQSSKIFRTNCDARDIAIIEESYLRTLLRDLII
jgi:hypothetical protein